MNVRSNHTEFAPRSVDNAVSVEELQQVRIDREINVQVADAARKFNKVVGKISLDEAYDIFEHIDFKHYASYDIVWNALNNTYQNQPEEAYRTDGIVARLQAALAKRDYKITNW